MRYLQDDVLLRKFIESGEECSTEIILEAYVRYKKEGFDVPQRVDDFVCNCLEKILKRYKHGQKPDYDDIFGFKFKRGAKGKSKSTKLNEMMRIGFRIEDYRDKEKHNFSYEEAIEQVATDMNLGLENVKKIYSHYLKLPDAPTYAPDDLPPKGGNQ